MANLLRTMPGGLFRSRHGMLLCSRLHSECYFWCYCFARRGYDDRFESYKTVFSSKNRIFAAYACSEGCNHFASVKSISGCILSDERILTLQSASFKKQDVRTLVITKPMVACDKLWKHVVFPELQNRVFSSLSDPVLRASMSVDVEVDRVYRALSTLDDTASFSKATLEGVGIIQVPADTQNAGRDTTIEEFEAGTYTHQTMDFGDDLDDD